jgi:hypothetical protein
MRKQHENGNKYPTEAKANSRLPDIDHAKTAVLNSLSSPESKRGYRHAIDEFIRWYCSEPRLSFSKHVVIRYRLHLEAPDWRRELLMGDWLPSVGLHTRRLIAAS